MKLLWLKLGVILGVVGIAILAYAENETRYSCKNIKTGMKREDVLNILGFPREKRSDPPYDKGKRFDPDSDSRGGFETWTYYRYGELPLKIFFISGEVRNCED